MVLPRWATVPPRCSSTSSATSGSLVQTISIPTAGGAQITCSGSATSEGALTLSSDRSVLTFAGYAASPGVAGIASTAAATYSRAVGVISANGTYSRVADGFQRV